MRWYNLVKSTLHLFIYIDRSRGEYLSLEGGIGGSCTPPFLDQIFKWIKKHLTDIHLYLEYDVYFTVLISHSEVCISRTPGFSKSQGLLKTCLAKVIWCLMFIESITSIMLKLHVCSSTNCIIILYFPQYMILYHLCDIHCNRKPCIVCSQLQ